MGRFADLAVMIDGCLRIDDRQVADRGVRIDHGASHNRHTMTDPCAGRNDGLRTDRVDELKSKRRYLRSYFATQRIIAERDKAVPNALPVEVRQNVIITQYRRANYVSSVRLTVRATHHFIEPLRSDQFYHHFRVATRTDHDHRLPGWRASAKPGVQRRGRPDKRDIHGKHF